MWLLFVLTETKIARASRGRVCGREEGHKAKCKSQSGKEALSTRSSKAKKPMNACVHTYTKSQTPSTRRRGPGWRIHGSVEDTKLSTNKLHTLSCVRMAFMHVSTGACTCVSECTPYTHRWVYTCVHTFTCTYLVRTYVHACMPHTQSTPPLSPSVSIQAVSSLSVCVCALT